MYQFLLGKISTLTADPLAATFADRAPQGARNVSWLAGRTLLARAFHPAPLPDIIYGEHGKPAFSDCYPLWFNLSHSGDDIALLLSDEGEVGCDIEAIRPRKNWQALADAVFSQAERDELNQQAPEQQLPAFWRIWTRKEALVKYAGGSVWLMSVLNSSHHAQCSALQLGSLSLAVCTSTHFTLSKELITFL
ncbi:4'-phosphopantetheinyl transferase AcpT [Enterobacter sp. Bisph1]|uniref:4'-phosphopantetheinyl transferase AcpT n=1 Tax=Enterobacter sp. Bisph1 TaxID=1274399 RepID=UPI00057BED2D|nr:4'-phosphopantetheinyl transferase AcpT [Enterobacter sp. Bisph1]